jgi:hypothetical protein
MGLGWMDAINPKWLSAGWTRSSMAGFRLAGRDRAGPTLGWLEKIELGWLSAGWMRSSRNASRLVGDDRAASINIVRTSMSIVNEESECEREREVL